MMLDIRTLSLTGGIVPVVFGLAFGAASLNLPTIGRATRWWSAGFLLQGIGFVLIFLRGSIPDFLSVFVANALLLWAPLMFLWGVNQHTRSSNRIVPGAAWLAGSVTLLAVASHAQFPYSLWAFTVSVASAAINLIVANKLWRAHDPTRFQQRLTACVFAATSLARVARAILSILGPAQSGLFAPSLSSTIGLVVAVVAPILVALGCVSMAARRMQMEREQMVQDLETAIGNVRTLSGLLPICASCKRIRDDNGRWHAVEVYVHDHSQANFTHSICPECSSALYPTYSMPREKKT
jgi:hypothetical protein